MKKRPQLNNISCSCCVSVTVVVVGQRVWLLSHVRPTSLDAVVYGHLQPLLKAPLGNSALRTHLKACRNLVAYCQRISNEYFPLSPEGSVCICCCVLYCSVLVYFTTFIVTVLNIGWEERLRNDLFLRQVGHETLSLKSVSTLQCHQRWSPFCAYLYMSVFPSVGTVVLVVYVVDDCQPTRCLQCFDAVSCDAVSWVARRASSL